MTQAGMVASAISFVLLVGAALLVRSFINLQRVDAGFETDRVVTAQRLLHRGPVDVPATRAALDVRKEKRDVSAR